MKILLGIDGSRYALAATRFVCEFLSEPGRQVDMLHVLPLVIQEGAAGRLHSRGFRVASRVRRGAPARVFPEVAAKGGYDLIVLGAKGRADNPYLRTGSVALAVLAALKSDDRRRLVGRVEAAARAWAREAKPLLARPGLRPQARVAQGRPAAAIIDEARSAGARLIVLGSRGARSPSGPPLGSVALQVAHYAPCSVLLVRGSL